ncbi:MAG: ornithine cyclodeaminase family protein [Actinomycetes bacterium]
MRLLTNADIASVLSMAEGIAALRTGYADLARGDAAYVPRIDLYAPTGRDDDYYQWGSMAGVCRSYGVVAVRIKSDVTSWPAGGTTEKYCVEPGTYSGIILLYSIVNGEPLALLQDGYLQHVRVGAAAGIGADLMARPDADTLGLIGSGGMARTYLEAIAEVRPLRSVRVYSPTPANRERLAAAGRAELGLDVRAVGSAREAVDGAAIVATATDAMGATFDPGWLAPGTHVTCVTRRELSHALVTRADRVLQLGVNTVPHGTPVPGMEWKAGGIASYVAGRPDERSRIPSSRGAETGVFPTLVDVHRGRAEGRTSDDEITLFVTTGTQGLQFAAVGGRVWQLARRRDLGHPFPTEWFLQDIRD